VIKDGEVKCCMRGCGKIALLVLTAALNEQTARFLTGSATLMAVLIAIDVFAGFLINGLIASAIGTGLAGAIMPIPIPISGPGLPPIVSSVSATSLNHGDAVPRTFISSGVAVSDGFRQHDLVVTLA
jgi:hypothetical protein